MHRLAHLLAPHERLPKRQALLVRVRKQPCRVLEVHGGKRALRLVRVHGRRAQALLPARVAQAVRRHKAHAQHIRTRKYRLPHGRRHGAVHLEHVERLAAAPRAVHPHGANVHPAGAQRARDVAQHARHVALVQDEGVVLPRYLHAVTVDHGQPRRAATHGLPARHDLVAVCVAHAHVHGVGVRHLRLGVRGDAKAKPALARDMQRVANPQVVRVHAQHARHKRAVRAMPAVRSRKRAVQRELHLHGRRVQKLARHLRNAQRPRGVRRRRPHHDRSQHVPQAKAPHGTLLRLHQRTAAMFRDGKPTETPAGRPRAPRAPWAHWARRTRPPGPRPHAKRRRPRLGRRLARAICGAVVRTVAAR